MLGNNVIKWASKIMDNARKELYHNALVCFLEMRRDGIEPNATTYSTTITICAKSLRPIFGTSLHGLILKEGFVRQLFVASGLVTMYSKNDYILEARRVFDDMTERDAAAWNAMIAGYSQKGLNTEACSLFIGMVKDTHWNLFVNHYTVASVLKACAALGCGNIGKPVHGYAIKLGLDLDSFVCGSTIDMYLKCGNLDMARSLFDRMENRDLVVWNTMITGFAQSCYGENAIELFYQMQYEGFLPNETTYASVIKATTVMPGCVMGKFFHAKTLKFGFFSNVFVGTALVDMYSKFFEIQDGKKAFDEMKKRNLVSFNALVTGYSLIGGYKKALRVYLDLQTEGMKPDWFTFIGLLSSCAVSRAVAEGVQIHSHGIMYGLDSDISVGNSIVNFYSKCGLVDCALKAFESIHTPNAISWAGIISCFAQNGEGEKALEQFCKMHKMSEKTDEFTASSVLKALASLAAVEQGRHLHAHVIKLGLEWMIFVASALVDLYSKCGVVEDANMVFSEMPEKNVVSWNSMITGYAQNGFCEEALLLFQEMTNSGILPTCVTFIGVLLACSHAGLVEEGRNYYKLMVHDYKFMPSVEHCTCMVDLLGRAGYLDEAETFLLNSPFSKEPGIWRSLLAACGVHKNSDVGKRSAQHCLWLEPYDSSTYTILSNIYASKELWGKVSETRNLMKEMSVEKKSGCSRIEVRN